MKYYILLIGALLGCMSCGESRNQSNKLDAAAELMFDHPEQALSILKSLDVDEISSRSGKARFALLYTQALDKNQIELQSDSLIHLAVDYYNRKGSEQEKALAHYYYGCVYANLHDIDVAMKSLVAAEAFAVNTNDSYLQGLIHSRIGNLYSDEYLQEDALLRFERARACFHQAGAARNEAISLNNKAYIYYLTGDFAAAKESWQEAKKLYLTLGDRNAAYAIDGNLISIRLEEGNPVDSIKNSFRKICFDYYGEPHPPVAAGTWLAIYQKAGELDSARLCGQTILANRHEFTDHQIAGCYALLTRIESDCGRFEQALRYSRLYQHMADSLNQVTQQTALQEVEQKYNNRLLKASLESFRLKHQVQMAGMIFILIILALIVVLVGYAWTRRYKKVREERALLKQELDNLHQVYDDLSNRFLQVRQMLDCSNERESKVSKAIEERLSGLHQLVEKLPAIKPANFVREFKRYMAVDTNSQYALYDLQYIVNQKYFGIIDYLKARYPDLNKHDLDLCALMCFGFSHAGICYLYDYSTLGSFYNKRSRLRRKLHLSQEEKIEDFISRQIAELRKNEE